MRRLLVCCLLAACNDAPAPPNLGSESGGASDSGGGVSSGGSADTGGTADVTTGGSEEVVLQLVLELEAIEEMSVEITRVGDELTAKIEVSRGYGVAPAGEPISGTARIDALPEAGATIYGARLSGPAVADGACGDEPVSLALALHHDEDASFVAGGLTAYCGADAWYGVPPIEPLRISGKMP
jgi:hypothetical protein